MNFNSKSAVVVLDHQGAMVRPNEGVSQVFGGLQLRMGEPVTNWFSDEDREAVEFALFRCMHGADVTLEARSLNFEGVSRVVETTFTTSPTGEVIAIFRNVTEQKAAEHEARLGVMKDGLTGLGSQLLFEERLAHAILRSSRGETRPGVVLMRVTPDEPTKTDENLEILQITAFRVQNYLRVSDTIAYVHHNTFAVLLEDVESEAQAVEVAKRLTELCALPISTDHGELSLNTRAGVVQARSSALVDDVLRSAELALGAAFENEANVCSWALVRGTGSSIAEA